MESMCRAVLVCIDPRWFPLPAMALQMATICLFAGYLQSFCVHSGLQAGPIYSATIDLTVQCAPFCATKQRIPVSLTFIYKF